MEDVSSKSLPFFFPHARPTRSTRISLLRRTDGTWHDIAMHARRVFFGPPPLIPRVISLCILKNDPRGQKRHYLILLGLFLSEPEFLQLSKSYQQSYQLSTSNIISYWWGPRNDQSCHYLYRGWGGRIRLACFSPPPQKKVPSGGRGTCHVRVRQSSTWPARRPPHGASPDVWKNRSGATQKMS